jgi:hypothetical protein
VKRRFAKQNAAEGPEAKQIPSGQRSDVARSSFSTLDLPSHQISQNAGKKNVKVTRNDLITYLKLLLHFSSSLNERELPSLCLCPGHDFRLFGVNPWISTALELFY